LKIIGPPATHLVPVGSQLVPGSQLPQVEPQPSAPQVLPLHCGWQAQVPALQLPEQQSPGAEQPVPLVAQQVPWQPPPQQSADAEQVLPLLRQQVPWLEQVPAQQSPGMPQGPCSAVQPQRKSVQAPEQHSAPLVHPVPDLEQQLEAGHSELAQQSAALVQEPPGSPQVARHRPPEQLPEQQSPATVQPAPVRWHERQTPRSQDRPAQHPLPPQVRASPWQSAHRPWLHCRLQQSDENSQLTPTALHPGAHWPLSQLWPRGQSPHEPEHPSEPHFLTPHSAEQLAQWPLASHFLPVEQSPQVLLQPSSPQSLPAQTGAQATHWPLAWSQWVPGRQLPHEPWQPLSPHCFLPQRGTQIG
jgi:hypothetical protein